MRKLLTFSILLTLFLSSCTRNESVQNQVNDSTVENFSLVGHTIMATYPEMKAEITYLSDSVLHWKTITDDQVAEADEKMYTKQVDNNLFFINWVEADGTRVSQVVDFTNHKISVFMTLLNDSKIGRDFQTSMLFEGTFEVLK